MKKHVSLWHVVDDGAILLHFMENPRIIRLIRLKLAFGSYNLMDGTKDILSRILFQTAKFPEHKPLRISLIYLDIYVESVVFF